VNIVVVVFGGVLLQELWDVAKWALGAA